MERLKIMWEMRGSFYETEMGSPVLRDKSCRCVPRNVFEGTDLF